MFWAYNDQCRDIDPFGLKIDLPINLDQNEGQNKNHLHISKFESNIRLKIVQLYLGCY